MQQVKGRDIIVSANNNEQVLILPIVPDVPVSSSQDNKKFKTADQGYMNLIGDVGLREFTISSIFPVAGTYPYMRPGSVDRPFRYVDFFNRYRNEKVPFRVIASRPDGTLWFNIPMTVDSFDYDLTKNGNVKYNLKLTEYVFHWELVDKWQ